jgi:hypothetical protein
VAKNPNAKYIERLEQLIRVLRGLSPHERRKHWDMSSWGYKSDCGTVACAAGHAGMDPWFTRRGFRLFPAEYDGMAGALSIDVEDFFGDPNDEDWALFGADEIFIYPKTVGDVIRAAQKRIRALRAAQ